MSWDPGFRVQSLAVKGPGFRMWAPFGGAFSDKGLVEGLMVIARITVWYIGCLPSNYALKAFRVVTWRLKYYCG